MRYAGTTPQQIEEALAEWGPKLDLNGHTDTKMLRPSQIKTLPVLFQPRSFSHDDSITTDKDHVKTLTKAVGVFGKLDPMTVIRLKGLGYVVVDGHHSLEAYKKAGKSGEEIECQWFPGTVREAFDESCRRNINDKLPMPEEDKMAAAWNRVFEAKRTVTEIRDTTGISPRSIQYMRALVKAAAAKTPTGEQFRERLREATKHSIAVPRLRDELDVLDQDRSVADALWRLKQISWLRARLIYKNVPEKQTTDEEEAVRLERLINRKLEHRLTEHYWVTALALRLHDPALPKQLMTAWRAQEDTPEIVEAAKSIAQRKAQEYRERSAKASQAAAEKLEAQKVRAAALGRERAAAAYGGANGPQQSTEGAEAATTASEAAASTTTAYAERRKLDQERSRLIGMIWERMKESFLKGPEGCLGD
jgi:hypothetical protein